jgi:hypothetical protein
VVRCGLLSRLPTALFHSAVQQCVPSDRIELSLVQLKGQALAEMAWNRFERTLTSSCADSSKIIMLPD